VTTFRYSFSIVVLLVILLFACDSTGPSLPSFNLESVVFTGDSTGLAPARIVQSESAAAGASSCGKNYPYLEMTLTWEKPEEDQRQTFTVFRSSDPSIQSDPEEAEELQTQFETTFADSAGLEWGSDYYYAIRAVDLNENCWWSNEVHVETPRSPFPVPRHLSFDKHHFIVCSLSWDVCQEETFASYILIRSTFPDIEHITYNKDTLLVTDDVNTLGYTDSIIGDVDERYYVVVTVDKDGLPAYSNEVEFQAGGNIPWRVDKRSSSTCILDEIGFTSADGERIYISRWHDYPVHYRLQILDPYSGGTPSLRVFDRISSIAERPNGNILVFHGYSGACSLSVCTEDLDCVIQATPVAFEFIHSVEVPEGSVILASRENNSYALDAYSLEPVSSFPFGFTDAVVSPDGGMVYLCGADKLICLRASDLEYLGDIAGSFNSVDYGSDGCIYCITDEGVFRYDSYTLSLCDEFLFPFPACGAVLLQPDCRMVYLLNRTESNEYTIEVFDTITGKGMGTVWSSQVIPYEYAQQFFLSSPQGEFIWGFTHDGLTVSYRYRITI